MQIGKKIKAKIKAKFLSDSSSNSATLSYEMQSLPSTSNGNGLKCAKSNHLDISYITPKLIVGSYPVTKYPKQLYRVSLTDLVNFLNKYHGANNWKIFNLKAEICDSDYSNWQFDEIVQQSSPNNQENELFLPSCLPSRTLLTRSGWLDHEVPPFGHLQTLLKSIGSALQTNNESAVFLHCKMGKGRSGLVASACLMSQLAITKEEALKMFEKARFKSSVIKGVTIKSQLRWLHYQGFYLQFDHAQQGIIYSTLTNKMSDGGKLCTFEINRIRIQNPFDLLVDSLKAQKVIDLVLLIDFQTYNNKRDGYLTLFQCEIDLQRFESTESPASTLSSGTENQTQQTFSLYGHSSSSEARYFTINLKKPLPPGVSDIRVSVSLKALRNRSLLSHFLPLSFSVHFWYNLYIETLFCSTKTHHEKFCQLESLKNEQEQCFQNVGMGNFQICWADLDGYKGTAAKGIKLFDSMDIHWSLI